MPKSSRHWPRGPCEGHCPILYAPPSWLEDLELFKARMERELLAGYLCRRPSQRRRIHHLLNCPFGSGACGLSPNDTHLRHAPRGRLSRDTRPRFPSHAPAAAPTICRLLSDFFLILDFYRHLVSFFAATFHPLTRPAFVNDFHRSRSKSPRTSQYRRAVWDFGLYSTVQRTCCVRGALAALVRPLGSLDVDWTKLGRQ